MTTGFDIYLLLQQKHMPVISKCIDAGGETEAHVIYCIFCQKQLCYSDAAHAIKVVYMGV